MSGVLDGIVTRDVDESGGILKLLTDTSKFNLNKIMGEIPPELIYQTVMMNAVNRRYPSKLLHNVLNELYLAQMAKDRKRCIEVVEVGSAIRNPATEED
jgi:hypothetical protein